MCVMTDGVHDLLSTFTKDSGFLWLTHQVMDLMNLRCDAGSQVVIGQQCQGRNDNTLQKSFWHVPCNVTCGCVKYFRQAADCGMNQSAPI
jgi:hypothetical protein